MWRATILTLFPEMFPGPLGLSLAGDALARGAVGAGDAQHSRARDRAPSRRRRHARRRRPRHGHARRCAGGRDRRGVARRRSAPAPADEPARRAADAGSACATSRRGPGAIILCGRFEGVDERVIDGARARGGLDRRLRALGRRDRGAGAHRRLRAAAAGRDGRGSCRAQRKASRAACSNIRTTRGRANGRAGPFRTCCCPAITRKIAKWRHEQALALTRGETAGSSPSKAGLRLSPRHARPCAGHPREG